MENEVIETPERKIMVTEEQKALVKSIVFPKCSDDELRLYLFECERRGVHPLDRLIYPIARTDKDGEKKITFQCSVDYLRSEAVDTGEYDGQDEPVFGESNKEGYPDFAKVAVYKKDINRPFVGTARWSEFYPGDKQGFMWRKMPFHMLAKCAEVLALRKAFPKRLAGLYIIEEMQAPNMGKPEIKKPERKKPENTKPELPIQKDIVTKIFSVDSKSGTTKNGEAYTIYTILDMDKNKYGTFSENFADIASSAKKDDIPVFIAYTDGKYGRDIVNLTIGVQDEVHT